MSCQWRRRPTLPTQRSIYLYPSICLFEGTVVSLGRGTDRPFECYGHPDMPADRYGFAFTPRPTAGAKHPPLEGRLCHGVDLSAKPLRGDPRRGADARLRDRRLSGLGLGGGFFTPMFEKLIGVGWVRGMILDGRSAAEIRARWQPDVQRFARLREKYLIYE